jgi:hypothetical protein|nr:MAG TPA_asm: Sporulation protein Cse60 [Caudoviricetes sp.]
MKVKIITLYDKYEFEKSINNQLRNYNSSDIIDIKFSTVATTYHITYTAMIIIKTEEEDEI